MKLYEIPVICLRSKTIQSGAGNVLENNFVMKYILESSFYCINIGPMNIMVYSISYIDL